jgi:nicotinate-nucleotide adenylyltransferase
MTTRIPTPARLASALGGFLPPAGLRIGLLGGSFNPAHGGHRHIALEALRRLKLDEVWWLVSPQNPLKSSQDMSDLKQRLAQARYVADHPRIRVTALEKVLGTQFTADTLEELHARLPGVGFVWLMGADNLAQLHRWDRWTRIFHTVPVAVFDRPSYSFNAVAAKAARRFARHRLAESSARRLADEPPPAWVFLHVRRDPRSATAIRARQGR